MGCIRLGKINGMKRAGEIVKYIRSIMEHIFGRMASIVSFEWSSDF